MASSVVVTFAAELHARLAPLGVPTAELDELLGSAQAIQTALNAAPNTLSAAAWDEVRARWVTARNAIAGHLADALLGAIAAIPGLAQLTRDVAALQREGVHGSFDLGPVHLSVSSATLTLQPPKLLGIAQPPEPIVIGPFRVGEISASLVSPFGGGKGMPGGGSIIRMPPSPDGTEGGFGGTLQLPLGPVRVSAAAVLANIDGQPTFLAVLGVTFTPPIQLSFGFSLDRVGGLIGVNRRADVEALRAAVRTGTGGDVLFSTKPPATPLALITAADRLFPAQTGSHLVGPTLRLSWLSFGEAGSLLGLDVGVIVEIPSGKVIVLGVARAAIPGQPYLLNLRLDLLGVVDPVEQLASIDASLVDSHVLGIFNVYGDAAMRLSWGSQAYFVVSVGGFYPGFNPEPARIPALRRVGLALDNPLPVLAIRAEGYFAITSNTIQFGGRLEISIALGIRASGFIQVDALVQFRPFHFEAGIAAGFSVSVAGFHFASVTLRGAISGPGPIVIRGSLSIDVFLFSLSWDETFTLGSGPADVLPTPLPLLDVLAEEFSNPANVTAADVGDAQVLLRPRPGQATVAAVPATGALQIRQRRAPLGVLIERIDGRPLDGPQGAVLAGSGVELTDRFAPGGYIQLSASEAMSRPPFDVLPAGRVLSLTDPDLSAFPAKADPRTVKQIVIKPGEEPIIHAGALLSLTHITDLMQAAGASPAVSDPAPLLTAHPERWTTTGTGHTFTSATAAHQSARHQGGVAVAEPDASDPVNLTGVL
jgi:hypothetical protein